VITRISIGLLTNADNPAVCAINMNAPALDLIDSLANVSSSVFQSVNTGVREWCWCWADVCDFV
jgi:hypothetical protein